MRLALRTRIAGAVALVTGASFGAHAWAWDTSPLQDVIVSSRHLCGAADLPEKGIQGSVPRADQRDGRAENGYNCGLALLGHTQLTKQVNGDTRAAGNANMAWAGHCAYISGSAGVSIAPQQKPSPPANAGIAVVSVTPDGTPSFVATLRKPGGVATAETINAVTTPSGRSILVVGQYGNDVFSKPKPMDVYDVSNPDCTKYKYLGTYYWPRNIHNLTLSADGRYVFATLPLQVADISGLFKKHKTGVVYLGNIQAAMGGLPVSTGPVADVEGVVPPKVFRYGRSLNVSHEAWPSPDNKTLYVGGSTAEFETFSILDMSKWLQRDKRNNPLGPLVVLSQQSGRGHSVRTATIGGVPYVLHSEESVFGQAYGCLPQEGAPFVGPAQPWLTNIANPRHPYQVSQFGLQINEARNCATQILDNENDSVHYHDVDNPQDTTFVMASMWNAGIRVFDVRNPRKPQEVAYFNPGDIAKGPSVRLDHAWGHIRYLPALGQLWFATADGGFWVVRIETQVRKYLGLDAKNKALGLPAVTAIARDRGYPGDVGESFQRPPQGWIDMTQYWCSLDSTIP